MITVSLTINDVTGSTSPSGPTQKSLHVVRQDSDNLIFRWLEHRRQVAEGTLYVDDWDEFLELVNTHETHRWILGNHLQGPMGEGDMPDIMKQLITTPAYHLFLGAIDIVAHLGVNSIPAPVQILNAPDYPVVLQFIHMTGFIPRVSGGGPLLVLPAELTSGNDEAISQLMFNGKIGTVCLDVDDYSAGIKHYVQTAPSGFTFTVSQEAQELWDKVLAEFRTSPN
jgi:hypothetical protein